MLWYVKSKRAQSDQDDESWVMGGVVPTLNAFDNGDSRVTVIIFDTGSHGDGIRMSEDTVPTLQARMGTGGNNTPMVTYPIDDGREIEEHQNGLGIGNDGDPAYTLDRSQHSSVATAVSPTLTAYNMDSRSPQSEESQRIVGSVFNTAGTVRRLTPTECERLQGFPDGWTSQRIDEKKGLIEQADSSRYKQMGNAVAVPCVEWIMARLVEQDNGR